MLGGKQANLYYSVSFPPSLFISDSLYHKYDWLCYLDTFIIILVQKGDQVTKPIIFVKICYKLLYAIQGVEKIFW